MVLLFIILGTALVVASNYDRVLHKPKLGIQGTWNKQTIIAGPLSS